MFRSADSHPPHADPRPIRVFLVEDQTMFAELLREILAADARFTVVGAAESGGAAIAGLTDAHPDLVLVDLALPDMSGHELIAQLKKGQPAYRIVVCTAAQSDQAVTMALAVGADDFIEKTTEIPEFLNRLEQIFRGEGGLSARVSNVLRKSLRGEERAVALTPEDLAILRRLALGESVAAIAQTAGLSVSGVYKVRKRIALRTGASGPQDLAELAVRLGLIQRGAGAKPGDKRGEGGRT